MDFGWCENKQNVIHSSKSSKTETKSIETKIKSMGTETESIETEGKIDEAEKSWKIAITISQYK